MVFVVKTMVFVGKAMVFLGPRSNRVKLWFS